MAISHISDTARWTAMCRALESERPDACFRDPLARRLAGPEGEELLTSVPKAQGWTWPMVARTAVMDELVEHLVEEDETDLVVNLAAGLDTRPYRLRLPAELRWVEVDLPEILAEKQEALAGETPACRLEHVALDLVERVRRRELFERLSREARRILVVAEGLLVYLHADEVKALARDLRQAPSVAWWCLDLASPQVLAWMEKTWGQSLAEGGVSFHFAPPESTAFFAPLGWREEVYRSLGEEAARLHRAPWWWSVSRFLGRFSSAAKREEWRRVSGVALLAPS
jgi:methyltransferase (TIGR00027 family)